ncbi:arsenic resistance protein [Microbacterium tumbae]
MLTPSGRAGAASVPFFGAILVGTLLGVLAPAASQTVNGFVDPLILVLVGVLFFTLRLEGASALRRAPRTALLAVGMNFLVIPVIALALTALLPGEALRVGVLIYCLAPCTDWFLGFTRLAGGDTAIGAALIPVQMILQLVLYPVWLALFAGRSVDAMLAIAGPTLLTWFLLPAAAGVALRLLLQAAMPATARRLTTAADGMVPFVIAAVIVGIFAGNVEIILADPGSFSWVLLAVFLFFVATFFAGAGVARLSGLTHPEHALLTMTTSARNAPLMLAVTVVALPDDPVVHAAIILGMLIEFPHLALLTHLLRRRPRVAEQRLILSR